MYASRLVLLSMAVSTVLLGQKKEDILSIQRDVANMDDRVKQLQKSFDDKIAALTALVQQSIDASNKTSAEMTAMQHSLDQKMADQQSKLVAPVATLGTKVDEMSGDFRAVRENVAELVRHMNDLDTKVADISSAVRQINNPVPAPPASASGVPAAGTATQVAEGPPAGWTAELAYSTAYRDFNNKKDEQAVDEFLQYIKYAPKSENAPNATYYLGMIYYRGQDWANAIKAFDAVLEQYPKNPRTSESQYMKACALMNDSQKTAAGQEFRSFIKNYPESTRAKDAHAHLRELGMETTRRKE
jgi:TolA-binding protein